MILSNIDVLMSYYISYHHWIFLYGASWRSSFLRRYFWKQLKLTFHFKNSFLKLIKSEIKIALKLIKIKIKNVKIAQFTLQMNILIIEIHRQKLSFFHSNPARKITDFSLQYPSILFLTGTPAKDKNCDRLPAYFSRLGSPPVEFFLIKSCLVSFYMFYPD